MSFIVAFLAYLENLIINRSFGQSSVYYPQTVHFFLRQNFWDTFFVFVMVFAAALCSLGVLLFVREYKKNLKSDFSDLSFFLRMEEKLVKRQAFFASAPKQLFLWAIIAPLIFLSVAIVDFFLGKGIGGQIKISFENNDADLFFGGLATVVFFILGWYACVILGGFFRR